MKVLAKLPAMATGMRSKGDGGRLHRVVIIPLMSGGGFSNAPLQHLYARCQWPSWTPTHGSAENWDIEIEARMAYIFVPRSWWDVRFAHIPGQEKVRAFSLALCDEGHSPQPDAFMWGLRKDPAQVFDFVRDAVYAFRTRRLGEHQA